MLQLTSRISLGVNVGNFLQLQRAFESNGIIDTAADEEQVLMRCDFLSIFLNFLRTGKNALYLLRQLLHGCNGFSNFLY
ncbi:hypothetical protein D3C76_1669520 [compost metagenome]